MAPHSPPHKLKPLALCSKFSTGFGFISQPSVTNLYKYQSHPSAPLKRCLKLVSIATVEEEKRIFNMCAVTEAWVVATSVGVVEALKDQGYGKLNNAMKSIHKHAKNQMKSAAQAKKLSKPSSSPAAAAMSSKKPRDDEDKNRSSEESLRTVMFLSTWGPNS